MSDTWAPREGAYGRTRDGRKVGPIRLSQYSGHTWQAYSFGDGYHLMMCWDGSGRYGLPTLDHPFDLVAEWTDEPAADADGWITWNGGECPGKWSDLYNLKLRNGLAALAKGDGWSWLHVGNGYDIVAYRIVKPASPGSPETTSPVDTVITAIRDTLADRAGEYGPADQSFARIANLWGAHLGTSITPRDVAAMLALLKIARLSETPDHADSWRDLAGYAVLGATLGGQP